MEHPARACLAEVVVTSPDGSTSRGSGYLVAAGWVLTAAHVVHDATGVGVWLGSPTELRPQDGHPVDPATARTIPGTDLALLPVPAAATPAGYVRPLLGTLDRTSTTDVGAVAAGFPLFKLRPAPGPPGVELREVRYATGRIVGASNAKTGTLELRLTDPPRPHPEAGRSPWEGMSGGPVFAHGHLVAVVGQHHPTESTGTLTARPLRLPDDVAATLGLPPDPARVAWADLLPQLAEPLPVVTPPTARDLASRRAQAAALQLIPEDGVLIAREAELADLAAFATGEQQWRWIRAQAFAGKTALLAFFALHPPEDVDVVACFLRSTTAENTAQEAMSVLNGQLAAYLQRTDDYRESRTSRLRFDFQDDLLPAAARAARQEGRHLLVLVDGLDEYDPDESLELSAWLPAAAALPEGVNLLVASREGVPVHLPDRHPLTGSTAHQALATSEVASQIRELAQAELDAAFRGDKKDPLKYAVARCLAATGGGISVTDLNAWFIRRGTRTPAESPEYLADQIGNWFHRSLHTIDDPDRTGAQVLVFAHETLRDAFQDKFVASLAELIDELRAWSDECQAERWPTDTPTYLLTRHPRLLATIRDVGRLEALALDQARHAALRALTGADAAALHEIGSAHHLHLGQSDIDLLTLGRLTRRRTHLQTRAGNIPTHLPAVWARLGHVGRAIGAASAISKKEDRAKALSELAHVLAATGRATDAEAVVELIVDARDRTKALIDVADELASAGHDDAGRIVEQARLAAEAQHQLLNQDADASGLCGLARTLARLGRLDDARRVADSIANDYLRAWAQAGLVEHMAALGQDAQAREVTQQALELARGVAHPPGRSSVLATLAGSLAAAARLARVHGIGDEARRASELVGPERSRTFTPVVLNGSRAAGYSELLREVADEARRCALDVADPSEQARALCQVSWALGTGGERGLAEEVAEEASLATDTIARPDQRAQALTSLAGAYVASADLDRARQTCDRIPFERGHGDDLSRLRSADLERERARALTAVTWALAKGGQREAARAAAERVREVANGIANERLRVNSLTELADAIAFAELPELALEFARHARGAADAITDSGTRATALCDLAWAVANAGGFEEATQLAERAHQDAEASTDSNTRTRDLDKVATALVSVGRYEQAERVARAIGEGYGRGNTVIVLVQALTEARQHQDARRIIRAVTEPEWGVRVLSAYAQALAKSGHVARAVGAARAVARCAGSLGTPVARVEVLTALTVALNGSGLDATIRGLADEAYDTFVDMDDPDERQQLVSSLAAALVVSGRFGEARTLTNDIPNPDSASWVLTLLAEALAADGQHGRARATAASIGYPHLQLRALTTLAVDLVKVGELRKARDVANLFRGDFRTPRVRMLTNLAEALADGGHKATAIQAVTRAEHAAWKHFDPSERARILTRLTRSLHTVGAYKDARRLADGAANVSRSLHYALERVTALTRLADVLAETGRSLTAQRLHEEAEAAAEAAENPEARLSSYLLVANQYTTAGRQLSAQRAIERAGSALQEITDPAMLIRALTRVAQDDARDVLVDAARTALGTVWLTSPWTDTAGILGAFDEQTLATLADEELMG